MSAFGLQLPVETTLTDLAYKAIRLNLNIFQCFLTQKLNGSHLSFRQDDIQLFKQLRQKHFSSLFLHASYKVNLSAVKIVHHPVLKKELELAKRLHFTHLVLHPGSAQKYSKQDGLDALVRVLNSVLKYENDITIVLENIAFNGKNIGGDIQDFYTILKKINYPEKLQFCIDTAHAHAYGYDLVDNKKQDEFIQLVESFVGWNKVALIHLNDTKEGMGTHVDRHNIPGTGTIGLKALQRFRSHDCTNTIPIIVEAPVMTEQEQQLLIKKMK